MNKVIIFSAPSGSGKTTLVRHVLDVVPDLAFSVSCTTRLPRGEEKDGEDYYFLTPEVFREKIAQDAFVEYEEVYQDKFYGTLKTEVERIWSQGKTVIFDVDVKGGIALKTYFGDQARSVFILPPSVAELERRLRGRGTDDEATIRERVAKAGEEMAYRDRFDRVVVNTDLEEAKNEVRLVVEDFIS
ncbi:guanylate kinase [Bergeyella sp. RCAD1439]|uniref:guanylate kinase n=1 Tax=Bergeyella anatis TaxID=3113737 RepID=UPI002E1925D5|nr:guanylate kinase [Bergeyella sp. RCAD1439]